MDELSEVTQADRDAAADYLDATGVDWGACADVRHGRMDHPSAQAFARHRTTAEAAKDEWIKELEAKLADCAPYLKPGQTPAERMRQDHEEMLGLMKLLQQEKERTEKLKWALQDAVTTNTENARLRDLYRHHLAKSADMIADMNTLVNDISGTRSFAGKMVEQEARAALKEIEHG